MKKYLLFVLLFLVILAGTFSGCAGPEKDIVSGTGTVKFVDLEGGFYGIIGDNGEGYDPLNLDDEYKEDGLRIRFRAELREDAESFHMWAPLVEIMEIERLE